MALLSRRRDLVCETAGLLLSPENPPSPSPVLEQTASRHSDTACPVSHFQNIHPLGVAKPVNQVNAKNNSIRLRGVLHWGGRIALD